MSIDDATPDEWYAAHMATLNDKAELTTRDIEALNMTLDKPFGELPLMTRAYVFLLHQTGRVTVRRKDGSSDLPQPTWMALNRYQVRAVEKPKTKPSIDWSQIKPEYKWLARDLNGKAWIYTHEPIKHTVNWRFPRGDGCDVTFMASYALGDCDWQDSLVERPGN